MYFSCPAFINNIRKMPATYRIEHIRYDKNTQYPTMDCVIFTKSLFQIINKAPSSCH